VFDVTAANRAVKMYKMLQVSVGLLFLGHALLGFSSFALDTCENIIPANTTSKLGESAVFKCRLASQNIDWTFCSRSAGPYTIASNCNLASSQVGRYRLDTTSNANACNLVIDNVTVSHYGTYTCQDMSVNDLGHTFDFGNSNENLALNKNAIQSTTWSTNNVANKAVDGKKDGIFANSCACTVNTGPEWWAVDLGQETQIGRVRITNTIDNIPERTQNFFIGLTNVSPWTVAAPSLSNSSVCKYFYGFPPGGIPLDIFCEPNTLPGRYLFVLMNRVDFLILCEVEAYYK